MATIGSLASSERKMVSTKLTAIDLHDWVAEVLAATASPAADGSNRPNPTKLPTLAPSGIPASVSSFVGREGRIDQIESLLGASRLLALGVAAHLCGAFPNGVAFVPLAPWA